MTLALLGMMLPPISFAVQEATPSPTPSGPSAGRTPDANCKTVEPPVLIHKVDPEYPADLRKHYVEGVVVLKGLIGTDGSVSDIRVLQSPAEPLTRLATAAMRQYRYRPAQCGGKPVRASVTLKISFAVTRP
jgi:TonB family protein